MSELDLILASGSPRRRDLLESLDLAFTIRPVDLDETPLDGEDPRDYVYRLARDKARAQANAGEVILAADTTVVLDGEILGKPIDPADARAMLGRMAGRSHVVLTGVSVYLPAAGGEGRQAITVERTEVEISALSEAEIAAYVETGEPLDKAGSYGIQGRGAMLVERVDGNYGTVVGLPLPATARLFEELGLRLTSFER